jgi:hypothetical protein
MVDSNLGTMNMGILAIGPRKDMASGMAVMDTAPSDNMRARNAPGTARALAVEAAMMRNALTDTTDTTITITMNGLVRNRIR